MLSGKDVRVSGQPLTEGIRSGNVHQMDVEEFRSVLNALIRERPNRLKAEE